MSYPLSGRLDVSQRCAWMRRLLGDWAMVGVGPPPGDPLGGARIIVSPKAGFIRPPG